jgi:hypothetical protein
MSTPDLILQLRLESLQRNLEQIQGIESSVRSRREDIVKLHGSVFGTAMEVPDASAEDVLAPLTGAIQELEMALAQIQLGAKLLQQGAELTPATRDTVVQAVGNATSASQNVSAQVDALKDITARLYRRWTEIHEDRLRETFRDSNALLTRLQKMTEGLEEEVREEAESEGGEGPGASDAWADYQTLYSEGLEDLFAGYVEVLGGLALRNIGFDQGVCAMADRLVEESIAISSRRVWESTAIPSVREARRRTLTRIIRLGFPEWTVWAVPLAMHGFSRVVLVASGDDVKRQLLGAGGDGEGVVLTADALATAIMGPAYACALVMLELDPSDAGDARRADTVFAMLDRLDTTEDMAAVRETLLTAWQAAVERAGGPRANGSGDVKARITDVLTFLQGEDLIYAADRWQRVTQWRLEGEGKVPIGPLDDTRDILNAAWWERLRPRGEDEPRSDDKLAEAAKRLWDRTMDRADQRVGGSGRRQSPSPSRY